MHIPTTFDFEGKTYHGELSDVLGAGTTTVYHLMINRYYRGTLRRSAFDNRWVFDGEFEKFAETFALWIAFCEWAHQEYHQDDQSFFYNMIDHADDFM